MATKKIQSKSILTKSTLPEVDYCINPYVGCLHGCVYCYARFMRRFVKHDEEWGKFLDIKINAPEILQKDLLHNPQRGAVLLGSVTDAYQPIERKYKITRTLLKVLLKHDFSISILTKSDLVVRDIDLLRQFSKCNVGLTITTLNTAIAKDFEPHAPLPQRRLKALHVLHENRIETYAFIGPILPYLTNLELIFAALKGKVDFVMAESLNLKCGNWKYIHRVLVRRYSHLLSIYEKGFSQKYWAEISEELKKLSDKFAIPLKGFYQH